MRRSSVFLIDDDTDDQEIFALALKEVDDTIQCHFANDGVSAIERLQKDTAFYPGFIFVDLNMPRMDGKKCLTEIKKIPRLKHIPVVIYSTSDDEKFFIEMKEMGASGYIVKPPNLSLLVKTLAELFKKYPFKNINK